MDPDVADPRSRRRSKRRAKDAAGHADGVQNAGAAEEGRARDEEKPATPPAQAAGTSPLSPEDVERMTSALLRVLRSLMMLAFYIR